MIDSSFDEPSPDLGATLRRLFERLDQLSQQNEQLHGQVRELSHQVAELRSLWLAGSSAESHAVAGSNELDTQETTQGPPLPFDHQPTNCNFQVQISEYEAGILFDEPAFDLTLRFNHGFGNRIARQWGFEDTGHLLLAILETCLQRIPGEKDKIEFRSDIESATVYARERSLLETARRNVLRAGASATGTFELIQQLSPESRRRE